MRKKSIQNLLIGFLTKNIIPMCNGFTIVKGILFDPHRTPSRESRRPTDVTFDAAIYDDKWRHPRHRVLFSIPTAGVVENGGPSASVAILDNIPHLRNRKWGHPRRRPEAEGPPFSTTTKMGIEKWPYTTLYHICLILLNAWVIRWKGFYNIGRIFRPPIYEYKITIDNII